VEAPHAYTLDNNGARIETLEEAVVQEACTLRAWEGHSNRVIVGSDQGVDMKIDHALAALSNALNAARACENTDGPLPVIGPA
jgi:hypothetical protein